MYNHVYWHHPHLHRRWWGCKTTHLMSLFWDFLKFFISVKIGFKCQDSEHYRADAVQPASGKCPPDTCIQMVRISPLEKKKTRTANAVLVFLVRVSRFELEASWTPFKRDTKLRHTRISSVSWRLQYDSTSVSKMQALFFVFSIYFFWMKRLLSGPKRKAAWWLL